MFVNSKTKNLSFIAVCLMWCSFSYAKEVLTFDCKVSGTSVQSLKPAENITEKLVYEHGEMPGGYKVSKTDFFSQGKKFETTLVSKTETSIISSTSIEQGKGYGRKVYLLSNFYDLEASEVTRLFITLPDGILEKNVGKCKLDKQQK